MEGKGKEGERGGKGQGKGGETSNAKGIGGRGWKGKGKEGIPGAHPKFFP